ncbi:hypothetical protein CTheo_6927 [Ceratobasidium theobromae]|uniref:Uncharacterized protein n=1 Tax=Ceratobasidium theobromae TaxID=1582974 RepID=A0A5N5QD09_9AGAM|nr:hypothetical protein CTheo_6927 [Ceratobasidium theobromae]
MALVEHSFSSSIGMTAPPTPHEERSFSQTLKRSASTASLLSPPASVRKPSAKRLRTQLAAEPDEAIHGDYLGRKQSVPTRPNTRSTKRKTVALRGFASAPLAATKKVEPVPRPSTPPPRFCVPLPECPQTPPPKSRLSTRVSRDAPLRDSPNNPFLVEPRDPEELLRSRPKRSASDYTEGSTVGYVFRGVPTVFMNPYAYQHPPSPTKDKDHPSFLPMEHPDFSPGELTRPKLLFPEAHGFACDDSPCRPCMSSTPKRGKSQAPKTPVRRVQPIDSKLMMMSPEQASGPKTPEPKTPRIHMRLRGASSTAVAGEMRVMRTRSKTAAALAGQ